MSVFTLLTIFNKKQIRLVKLVYYKLCVFQLIEALIARVEIA